MSKLLIINPEGQQEIIEVDEGGGYFDSSKVLWNESVDGAMPEVTLGGMVRNGNALEYSASEYATYSAAIGLPAARAKLNAEIDAYRDSLVYSDIDATFPGGDAVIQYRGVRDHNALSSVVQGAMSLILAGTPEALVTFITKDNVQQSLRADAMLAIGQAALAEKQAIYIAARNKKDAVALLDQSGIDAYDVSAGW